MREADLAVERMSARPLIRLVSRAGHGPIQDSEPMGGRRESAPKTAVSGIDEPATRATVLTSLVM